MRYTIVDRLDEKSASTSRYIHEKLVNTHMERDDDNPQLVIVIGGDGTFLVAAHKYLEIISDVIMVGIHTGTLGFFADFKLDEVDLLIQLILTKKPNISSKRLLKTRVICSDGTENLYYSLNEVRIENVVKTQILKVWVNEVYLETFRGTGICVSTQAGSTGYHRSLKGAVIYDSLELMQMAEITGIHHRLFQSLQVPLILSSESTITFASPSFKEAILAYDHLSVEVKTAKHVICTLSNSKRINFARYKPGLTYIHRIKSLF